LEIKLFQEMLFVINLSNFQLVINDEITEKKIRTIDKFMDSNYKSANGNFEGKYKAYIC
jgi:hypothetical protein